MDGLVKVKVKVKVKKGANCARRTSTGWDAALKPHWLPA
jgi:hypothetical protein